MSFPVCCTYCGWDGESDEVHRNEYVSLCPQCDNDGTIVPYINPKLLELCTDVLAHAELDYEVTINGNGVNASECSEMAIAVMKILGVTVSNLEDSIRDRVDELEKMYN